MQTDPSKAVSPNSVSTSINGWKSLKERYRSSAASTPTSVRSSERLARTTSTAEEDESTVQVAATPKHSSSFVVPPSATTVDIRIIDTTSYLKSNASFTLKPDIDGHSVLAMPSYSFLIQHHPSDTNMLFDLGIRKDWEEGLPPVLKPLVRASPDEQALLHICVEKDVKDILDAGYESTGIKSADINVVIWSHSHFDHRGDISRFGPKTSLIVGPGTGSACLPGYPSCENSDFLEADLEGRDVREMRLEEFDTRVGGFRAYDAFNDGSFYLLHCPGHSKGHMGVLARTTPTTDTSKGTFVFLGADCAHHCAEFRPSKYQPLPRTISLGPIHSKFTADLKPGTPTMEIDPLLPLQGSSIQDTLHPCGVADEPFYDPPCEPTCYDEVDAFKTLRKLQKMDSHENVLVCLSHDKTLRSILPLFPAKVNEWYRRGYKEQLRWEFLRDFDLSGCLES